MAKKTALFTLLIFVVTVSLYGQNLPLKVGDKPPKLDFKRLKNGSTDEPLTWKRLKNQVVIIDFWATWCPPCIKSFPHLNALSKEFADKPVTFLSITYEPPNMLKPFLEKYKLDTIIGIDSDFTMFKSYGAWGIPMIVMVNQKGRIASVIHPNYLTNELIHEVLAGKIPKVEQAETWPDPEGAEEYFRSLVKPQE